MTDSENKPDDDNNWVVESINSICLTIIILVILKHYHFC
jgi:hypothetical protein